MGNPGFQSQRSGFAQPFGNPPQPGPGGFPAQNQPGPNPGGPPFASGQYPPAYPWPKPKKQSGGAWWLALPVVVLGLMVGYFALTQQSGAKPTNGTKTNDGKEVVYVNEEYEVPRAGQGPSKPVDPFNDPDLLDKNKFYEQKVPKPVRCEAEDADMGDTKAVEKRLQELSECLTRTFGPPLEAAGYQSYQPRVVVFEGSGGKTPCGELESHNAFFCAGNQGIYFSADLGEVIGNNQTVWDYVMAHEYGHNVQGRNGILLQRIYAQQDASSDDEKFEINRRLEVQADCLAATFINSNAESMGYDERDFKTVEKAARRVGDPADAEKPAHGRSDSRGLWTKRGLEATTYQECNSFVAPAGEVK